MKLEDAFIHPGLYCDENHVYRWNGRRVLGVNEVLQSVGLQDFSFAKAGSAERGTAVHLACEQYDKGELEELPPEAAPWLDAYKSFLFDYQPLVLATEVALFHELLGFAGRPDVLMFCKGDYMVIDRKSVNVMRRPQRAVGLALSAYSMLVAANWQTLTGKAEPSPTLKRFALMLDPNKYKLVPFNDPSDLSYWTAALSVAKLRKEIFPNAA